MKKLFYLLLTFLFIACSQKESFEPTGIKHTVKRETANIHDSTDYRAKASGVWSDTSIWQYNSAGVWIDAHDIPGSTNDVYLEQSIGVELDSLQECKNINLNTYADIIRLNTGAYNLNVWGKLRIYEGSYPGGSSVVFTSGILNWITGALCFKGDSRTIIEEGEYNANNTNSGWLAKIQFNSGEEAFVDERVRIENVIVESGILKFREQLRLGTNIPNNTADSIINGKIIVRNGASLTGGVLIYKNKNYPCDSIIFESGSTLNLTRNLDLYGRTVVRNGTENLNGYTLTAH